MNLRDVGWEVVGLHFNCELTKRDFNRRDLNPYFHYITSPNIHRPIPWPIGIPNYNHVIENFDDDITNDHERPKAIIWVWDKISRDQCYLHVFSTRIQILKSSKILLGLGLIHSSQRASLEHLEGKAEIQSRPWSVWKCGKAGRGDLLVIEPPVAAIPEEVGLTIFPL